MPDSDGETPLADDAHPAAVIKAAAIVGGASTGAVSASASIIADGDWICGEADCKNVNFARRTACNRCSKERVLDAAARKKLSTEIGKAAAEKSRGLFSAEDWQCSKCANVNWARRNTCNMCNAPKFTDVEERTGYGGGYNDRGVVEYKEHKEASDDEYDEFGRRRKKRDDRSMATTSSIVAKSSDARHRTDEPTKSAVTEVSAAPLRRTDTISPSPNKEKDEDDEEDDEEEEDDSDEEDLAKYDLWGDDDGETNKIESKPSNSVQRSNDKKSINSSASSSTSSSSNSSSAAAKGKSQTRHSHAKTRSRSPSRPKVAPTTARSSRRSRSSSRSRSRSDRNPSSSKSNHHRSNGYGGRSRHSRSRSRSRSSRPHNHHTSHNKPRNGSSAIRSGSSARSRSPTNHRQRR